MYTMADQSWRSRPRVMSRATIDSAAFRIAEHAGAHGVHDLDVVLHGGEPLLAGPETITYAVRAVHEALGDDTRADVSVQTNGLLLDRRFLDLFAGLDVTVGLSLDGDQSVHDRHRRHRDGSGSYEQVAAAATRLAGYPGLFSGFLSVIDVRSDPVTAYESLLEFSPPMIDFLLPHANWSSPPPGAAQPYGDWLVRVFDRWYQAPRRETRIRLFEEILNLLLGGSSASEQIGTSPVAVIVIETDGEIERSDMLKAAYAGAGSTGRNVATAALDEVLLTAHAAAPSPAAAGLAPRCRACPVVSVCGGGLHAHRYRAGHGFDNPSVYCPALYHLITHIRARITADLSRLSPRGT